MTEIDENTQALLNEFRERMEKEKAEKELNDRRNATLDAIRKDPNYEILKSGGIEEMIKETPAILDSEAALKMAIKNATLQIKSKELENKKAEAPKPAESNYNPASPAALESNKDDEGPLPYDKFFEKMNSGNATLKDLERAQLDPFVEFPMRIAVKKGQRGNNDELIMKGRMVLGTDD